MHVRKWKSPFALPEYKRCSGQTITLYANPESPLADHRALIAPASSVRSTAHRCIVLPLHMSCKLNDGSEQLDRRRLNPTGVITIACPGTITRRLLTSIMGNLVNAFHNLKIEH